MQVVEAILKFFAKIFKKESFQKKYRNIKAKKLHKIINSSKWQIIDLRPWASWMDCHIKTSINTPALTFKFTYFNKIKRNKKILIVNNDSRSNLNLFHFLQKRNFKVYLLLEGIKNIRYKKHFDKYLNVNVVMK